MGIIKFYWPAIRAFARISIRRTFGQAVFATQTQSTWKEGHYEFMTGGDTLIRQ